MGKNVALTQFALRAASTADVLRGHGHVHGTGAHLDLAFDLFGRFLGKVRMRPGVAADRVPVLGHLL